jgi:effector-binding domain-containing protein
MGATDMAYEVSVSAISSRPTAVIDAATTWQAFPSLWPELLGEVWACLQESGVTGGCPNVMLYKDDVPHVEVGVELRQPYPLSGRVRNSTLPAGDVAMTVHRGPYNGLADAHRAVIDWCAAQGLQPAGPRWEIYGPHHDDPDQLRTEVFYLLSPGK